MTDAQRRIVSYLRSGWRVVCTRNLPGAFVRGNARCIPPPGSQLGDVASLKTLQALEGEGLVVVEQDDTRREWRLTAAGWEG